MKVPKSRTGNHYKHHAKKSMMRVFVAIEVTDPHVIESIKKLQSEFDVKAKATAPHNLHFTIQFLGEISEETVDKIKERLESIRFSPFDVTFTGVGAFPRPSRPRIVWIGTDVQGGEKLTELATKVEDELGKIGFKSDKPFKPHITIFRFKNKPKDIRKDLEKFSKIEFGKQEISEVKLKSSILTSEGPNYSDLLVIKARLQ